MITSFSNNFDINKSIKNHGEQKQRGWGWSAGDPISQELTEYTDEAWGKMPVEIELNTWRLLSHRKKESVWLIYLEVLQRIHKAIIQHSHNTRKASMSRVPEQREIQWLLSGKFSKILLCAKHFHKHLSESSQLSEANLCVYFTNDSSGA